MKRLFSIDHSSLFIPRTIFSFCTRLLPLVQLHHQSRHNHHFTGRRSTSFHVQCIVIQVMMPCRARASASGFTYACAQVCSRTCKKRMRRHFLYACASTRLQVGWPCTFNCSQCNAACEVCLVSAPSRVTVRQALRRPEDERMNSEKVTLKR